MALVNALGIKDGFGFSAGFIDYVLFRFAIRKFNLRTPGREELGVED